MRGCGALTARTTMLLPSPARAAGCAPRAARGAWPSRRRTWWSMFYPTGRVASACCRFPSDCAPSEGGILSAAMAAASGLMRLNALSTVSLQSVEVFLRGFVGLCVGLEREPDGAAFGVLEQFAFLEVPQPRSLRRRPCRCSTDWPCATGMVPGCVVGRIQAGWRRHSIFGGDRHAGLVPARLLCPSSLPPLCLSMDGVRGRESL